MPSRLIQLSDSDLHDQIVRLEADMDELAERMDRCRRIDLAAKLASAAGAIWLSATLFGAITSNPMLMVAALAMVIGGIVVFGSNAATSKEAARKIKAAEALRADLIERSNPRVVGELTG
jgi:hypothetical protein